MIDVNHYCVLLSSAYVLNIVNLSSLTTLKNNKPVYCSSRWSGNLSSLTTGKRDSCLLFFHALYPLGPVATLRFCHLRPRCVSKQRRTTNVIITDRVWWIWCDAGLAAVATRPQRSPHSVASNSRPDYFAATRSRSLFLTKNECCVSAAAAAIWEIQWRRTYAAAGPSGYRGSRWSGKRDSLYLIHRLMRAEHNNGLHQSHGLIATFITLHI